ncbi:MBL fold metallo-hydrolase [Methylocapsa acidiphila]|uniref:MBL fold metallo-hydrolase n=1 Tax=Methylocapsa acidiphila TaxID=133552 RepID=UPI0004175CAF|nr:MBL fold metallo-hydrolase [Methylocapsa acidiphila]
MNAQSQSEEIAFDRSLPARPGELVRLSPLVRRMIAGNAGPMTFTGTCTYVVGNGPVAIIDPGPDDPAHISALLEVLGDETIAAILVTHTHRDHSPGARLLKQASGAKIIGCAPHRPSQEAGFGRLDAAHDRDHAPDAIMSEGDSIETAEFALTCVETPGHAANHLAFALAQEDALFSGDHVMAWSTTVVAPPDGAMRDYMNSLEKLRLRNDKIYWPGHGGPVVAPQRYVRALAQHRRAREAAILSRIAAGDSSIDAIVAHIYEGLNPALRVAAALSVLAHLEGLVARGQVAAEGPATLEAVYRPA